MTALTIFSFYFCVENENRIKIQPTLVVVLYEWVYRGIVGLQNDTLLIIRNYFENSVTRSERLVIRKLNFLYVPNLLIKVTRYDVSN